jgi:hypothetical protein
LEGGYRLALTNKKLSSSSMFLRYGVAHQQTSSAVSSQRAPSRDLSSQAALPAMFGLLDQVSWPSDFGVFELGSVLIRESTHPFSRFRFIAPWWPVGGLWCAARLGTPTAEFDPSDRAGIATAFAGAGERPQTCRGTEDLCARTDVGGRGSGRNVWRLYLCEAMVEHERKD